MLRTISLVIGSAVGLLALEAGKDALLDKAIADQYPREVRKMAYAVFTDIEKQTAEVPDAEFAKLGIKRSYQYDVWRRRVIEGDCPVQVIKEAFRETQLTPEQRDAERQARIDALLKKAKAEGTPP